jgi:hypothetical protein
VDGDGRQNGRSLGIGVDRWQRVVLCVHGHLAVVKRIKVIILIGHFVVKALTLLGRLGVGGASSPRWSTTEAP